MAEFERNLAQIYESTYKELFESLPASDKDIVLAGKLKPDEENEIADMFAARVIEKAEAIYDKQLAPKIVSGDNKKQ